jgi:hypothetical protein
METDVNVFLKSTRNKKQETLEKNLFFVGTSVGDPWHFGADPDPDPRIRTSG